MNNHSIVEGTKASQQGMSLSRKRHASATVCVLMSIIALLVSIPVWVMARKAAVWSGGSENWDAYLLFVIGGGILIFQALIALAFLIVSICMFKKWTRCEKWACVATLPLPVISTLLAFVYSSPFYG